MNIKKKINVPKANIRRLEDELKTLVLIVSIGHLTKLEGVVCMTVTRPPFKGKRTSSKAFGSFFLDSSAMRRHAPLDRARKISTMEGSNVGGDDK